MTSLRAYSPLQMPARPAPSISGRYRLASRSIYNSARPQSITMSEPKRYLNAVLMLALGRCAKDVFQDFCNLDGVKGRFRAEKAAVWGIFAQQEKVLFRDVTKEEAVAFSDIVCEVTDLCEQRTKWLVATVRDELSGKIAYPSVVPGALLGIAHAMCQCCNRINRIMTGRETSCYTRVMDEFELIDERIQQEYLNEGITADWERVTEAVVSTVKDMQQATMKVLGLEKKEEGGER